MSDWLHKIAITKIPKVGPILARNLISYCGGVEAVFKAKPTALEKIPGIGAKTAKVIARQSYFDLAEKELIFIEKKNISPLFFLDDNYPSRLKPLDDSPIMLYYKGTADLNHPRIVAVVGTRKPAKMSVVVCEELVEDLKAFNVLIISLVDPSHQRAPLRQDLGDAHDGNLFHRKEALKPLSRHQ
ncbi:MAG: DNA-processing protein DprA, partial [Bacteroidota bacterium]